MKEPNSLEKKPGKPRRAKGQTQTSISISESILRRAREAAEEQRRSFSQWIEILLENHFKRMDLQADSETPSLKAVEQNRHISKILRFELPFHGYAAAGTPVISQTNGETVTVEKEYPAGYFVVEVNGASMEPTLPDGCRIICEPREYSPKHDKVCIISDGYGSSVKRYDSKRKAFVSDNKDFPDFTPVDEVKLQGYFVEIIAD